MNTEQVKPCDQVVQLLIITIMVIINIQNDIDEQQVQPCDQVVQLLDWYERSDCFILVI